MRSFRTYGQVEEGSADLLEQVEAQADRLARRLRSVRHTWLVASGKGGVGKSAMTANLAAALAARGHAVGAADADLNGPSLAAMLGADRSPLRVDGNGVHPAGSRSGVRVMSTDLLLPDAAPLRWRGPGAGDFLYQSTLERGTLREILSDVAWGTLDHLLLDLPPGTDKLLRVLQLLPEPPGVLVVTTPSAAALAVVRRTLPLLREAGVPSAGLIVNMGPWLCPGCGAPEPLFPDDEGARALAAESGVPLWGEVPFDPRLARWTDAGQPLVLREPDTPAARALLAVAERMERVHGAAAAPPEAPSSGGGSPRPRDAGVATSPIDAEASP